MRLHARFTVDRGPNGIDVAFECDDQRTLALVGPNGAGKSSCLQVIAGLVGIDSGRIEVDGRCFDDGKAQRVPPELRAVGLVPQEALLFPHLSVLDNVSYGLRARGVGRGEAAREARQWLDRVALTGLERKRPAELSGGQAQRVALARALASRPSILLLDEALSALDASTRLALRRDLREHLDAFAGLRIVVAHDVVDALALADRLAVIEDGRIVQQGSAQEVCEEPRTRYVADLVGINFWKAKARAGRLDLEASGSLAAATKLEGDVFATIHPRAVALYRQRPDGSPRNVWLASVSTIETAAERVRVVLEADVDLVAELTAAACRELQIEAGTQVWVAIKATEVAVYPR